MHNEWTEGDQRKPGFKAFGRKQPFNENANIKKYSKSARFRRKPERRTCYVDVATHKLLWGQPSSNKVTDEYVLRFSIDNSMLFVGTRGPHVVSLNAQTGKFLGSWAATPDGEHKSGYGLPYVSCIAVSPDGEYVAAVIEGVAGGDVYVRSLRNKRTVRLVHGSKGVVNAVAFSPDSKRLASMDSDSICIWSKRVWE